MGFTIFEVRAHLSNSPLKTWNSLCALIVCAAMLSLRIGAAQILGSAESAPLRKVAEVRALDEAQASKHRPVILRGVVTTFSGWEDSFFLQDSTGGIAVNREETETVHSGDEIELSGVSDPGRFAASVNSKHIRVIGPGVLPAAHVYTYAEMVGGNEDSQWVGIRGIVESARIQTIWNKTILVLSVRSGGGPIEVRIVRFEEGDAQRLIDTLVRVDGVCGTAYNEKRQFTGLRLFVPDAGTITVLELGPEDPYALPISPMRSLLQYRVGSRTGHRVKVAGTITYQEPGRLLYVQSGDDGIEVASEQTVPVPPGTRIEVVGFPTLSGYSPGLRNAEFRVVGSGASIAPVFIQAKNFLQEGPTLEYAPYDGELVRLDAEVVSSIDDGPGLSSWLLRDGKGDFVANLVRGAGAATHSAIEIGSRVSVTGVLRVRMDEYRQPQTFRILMRTPGDLVVTKAAPWWTPLHLAGVLVVVLLATLGTALWIVLLRRQVRRQTGMLRESEERFRNQAQHDSLTGLASRLFFMEKLDTAIHKADEKGSQIGLLMIDLDHFKQVNDTLGHQAGDELLCIIAARIRQSVRATDTVARMGGDEFVVLLEGPNTASAARRIGSMVVTNLSTPAHVSGKLLSPSASVGVCLYPDGSHDVKALLHKVDAAMYRAKIAGRNGLFMSQEVEVAPVKTSR